MVLWEQRRAHISAEPSWMIWIGRPGALRNILDGVPGDFWPKINEQMFVPKGVRGSALPCDLLPNVVNLVTATSQTARPV